MSLVEPIYYIDRQGRRQVLSTGVDPLRGHDTDIPTALDAVRTEYGNLVIGLLTLPARPYHLLPFLDHLRGAVQKAQEACYLQMSRDADVEAAASRSISTPRAKPTLEDVISQLEEPQ